MNKVERKYLPHRLFETPTLFMAQQHEAKTWLDHETLRIPLFAKQSELAYIQQQVSILISKQGVMLSEEISKYWLRFLGSNIVACVLETMLKIMSQIRLHNLKLIIHFMNFNNKLEVEH